MGHRALEKKQKEKERENEPHVQREEKEEKPPSKLELKYAAVVNQSGYNEYTRLYQDKLKKMKLLDTSVKENKDYFRRMKAMIQAEKDSEKQKKMLEEFRAIFNERKENIKQYKNQSASIAAELKVIKQRINTYVIQQR